MKRTLRVAMCWLGVTIATSPALAQKGDDPYREGMAAYRQSNWAKAEQDFRRAISIDPKESKREVRRGNRFIGTIGQVLGGDGDPYLPYARLGEVLAKQDRCLDAIATWAESEQQKVVAGVPDVLKSLQAGYTECDKKGFLSPARYLPMRDRAVKELAEAQAMAGALEEKAKANAVVWTSAMQGDLDRARTEIDSGSRSLEAAQKSRSQEDFARVTVAAERAKEILTGAGRSLDVAIAARASAQQQAAAIREDLVEAEALDRRVSDREALLTPTVSSKRQYGREAIGRARAKLAEAEKAPSAAFFAEARVFVGGATNTLRAVLSDLDLIEREAGKARLAGAVNRAREAFSFADGAYANVQRLIAERPGGVTPEATAAAEKGRRALVGLRRRLEVASNATDIAAIDQVVTGVGRVKNDLDAAATLFGPLTLVDRGVHAALLEGSKQYFAGDYQQALVTLSPAEGFSPDLPLRLHVHLFRAAAHHALFVKSKETDLNARAQAVAEIDAVRQIDPGFEPDARAFSPRFLAFYRSGGAAPPAAPVGKP